MGPGVNGVPCFWCTWWCCANPAPPCGNGNPAYADPAQASYSHVLALCSHMQTLCSICYSCWLHICRIFAAINWSCAATCCS